MNISARLPRTGLSDEPSLALEPNVGSEETWHCGRCGQESETIYFIDGGRVCEACCDRERREKRIAALREVEKRVGAG